MLLDGKARFTQAQTISIGLSLGWATGRNRIFIEKVAVSNLSTIFCILYLGLGYICRAYSNNYTLVLARHHVEGPSAGYSPQRLIASVSLVLFHDVDGSLSSLSSTEWYLALPRTTTDLKPVHAMLGNNFVSHQWLKTSQFISMWQSANLFDFDPPNQAYIN